jgi:hypothetical protein
MVGYSTFAKWSSLPVMVYVNPANSDVSSSAAEAAVKVAMDAWSSAGSPFRYGYGGRVSDTSIGYDAKNVVLFRNTTNGGALATTYWWTMSGKVVDADVIVWDAQSQLFTGTSGCLTGGVFIEDVMTHELGHALGLNHSTVSDATMYGSYTRCSQSLRTLASDDIAGLRALYGSTTSTTSTTSNTAPKVTIGSPFGGATYASGATISFSGSAQDVEDGTMTSRLVWTSSLDGSIGSGGTFSRTLSPGSHVITASVRDSGGLNASAQVKISIATSTTSTVASATLSATGFKVKAGYQRVDLRWQGLSSTSVDVVRNGAKVATTANDGVYIDSTGRKGGGSYTYKVCAAGTTTCTNTVTVAF